MRYRAANQARVPVLRRLRVWTQLHMDGRNGSSKRAHSAHQDRLADSNADGGCVCLAVYAILRCNQNLGAANLLCSTNGQLATIEGERER